MHVFDEWMNFYREDYKNYEISEIDILQSRRDEAFIQRNIRFNISLINPINLFHIASTSYPLRLNFNTLLNCKNAHIPRWTHSMQH